MKQGFVTNMPGQLNSFNNLLVGTGKTYTIAEQSSLLESAKPIFWDAKGAECCDSKNDADQCRVYKVLYTGCQNAEGEEILGLFTFSSKRGRFEGVKWGTYNSFQQSISLRCSYYWLGDLAFESRKQLCTFLSDLADIAIPEPWDNTSESKTGGFDFLRSHIEHMFAKLRKEQASGEKDKILISGDGRHILWNTNLPSRYGQDILLCADVMKKPSGDEYFTSIRVITNGIRELRALGFSGNVSPKTASFFKDANDVVYHPDWKVDIDSNFRKLRHVVEDNRARFPKFYQTKATVYVARCLTNAIALSCTLAKRDYRFIVPMYSSTHDEISFLMPLYLGGQIKKTPDLAVILSADNGYYIPETVIGMREAYMDARLITRPSESWIR